MAYFSVILVEEIIAFWLPKPLHGKQIKTPKKSESKAQPDALKSKKRVHESVGTTLPTPPQPAPTFDTLLVLGSSSTISVKDVSRK